MLLKNNYLYSLILLATITIIACKKEVNERTAPEFKATAIDANGGDWETVLLTNSSEVSIPAPDAVNSSAYQAEMTQIAQLQGNLSYNDKKIINTWKSSGMVKWNEMARALVAKYNLPPEANPDGTYPAPSAANPGAYPKFPFANPPYASRAYAYVSTALYDALVACWKYKFQYNRKAPSVNDSRIKALETLQTDLPSYPSEDAVVAQVNYRLLKVFFPLDSVQLLQMATEQKKAKLLSGAASATDIAAGDAIANYVATKALARTKTDGMSLAAGNPTLWAELESKAVARGATTPWKSLEIPVRPAMLPLFGNVKMWNISSEQRDSLRPPPPPPVGSVQFLTALNEVKHYATHPSGETWRIAMYWSDGVGTYTPPGHWNEIACNLLAKYPLNELRIARMLSLINMAMADAGICCWDTKTYYYYPRPSQMDGSIKTIGLPNFPSYTSGHATFSGAASTVLGYLFPQDQAQLEAMAAEATISRVYGGIHYRFDSEVGLACGKQIGSFAVKRAQADGAN